MQRPDGLAHINYDVNMVDTGEQSVLRVATANACPCLTCDAIGSSELNKLFAMVRGGPP